MPTVTRARAKANAQAPPSTVFQGQFWNTDDIVMYTLRYLCLLDLVSLSQCNRRLHAIRKAMLRGRVSRYVTPFFKPIEHHLPGIPQEVPEFHTFFNMLLWTRSWIVGSISLAVAIVLSDPVVPHNLNVITSHVYRQEWMDFFEEHGFSVAFDRRARGAYAHEGGRVLRFDHPDRPKKVITLTTSTATHIFKLFLSAPITSQQVALGTHHLITPYPVTISNQEAVQGWCPSMGNHPGVYTFVDHRTYLEYTAFPDAVTFHSSTESWTRPCGEVCAAVWRDTYRRKNIAQWSWGGVDGADQHTDLNYAGIGRAHLQFRLGVGCRNSKCKLSPTYVAPSTEGLEDDGDDSASEGDESEEGGGALIV
ncbi:hypothetical protein B0H11DRAFT_2218607 [Mycena galericulata]|nr:hypothetical protein B0H11DRAFT_2218607 [Mycena galericulata]